MIPHLRILRRALSQSWALALRFSEGQAPRVLLISSLQVILQKAAVASVLPFLSLATASSPETSQVGSLLRQWIPWSEGRESLLLGSVVIVLQIAAAAAGFVGDYSRARFAHFSAHRLATELMRRVSQRPYLDHLQANTSQCLKRLRDDVHLYLTEVLLPLLDLVVRSTAALLLMGVLFLANPPVALVVAGAFGLAYAAVLTGLRGILSRANRLRHELVKSQFLAASELLQHYKILLVHEARHLFTQSYTQASQDLAATEAPISVIRATPRVLMEALAFSTLVILLLWGLAHPQAAPSIVPLAGTYAMAGYRLLPSLSLVYSQLISVLTRQALVTELLQELRNHPAPHPSPSFTPLKSAFPKTIRFDSVQFRFPNQDRPVLQDFHLTIERNTRVAIAGPSGAGKSTALDLLLALFPPSSGAILLDGVPLAEVDPLEWRRHIGYVPQEAVLLDASLRDNITFGLPLRQEILDEVLRATQLDRWITTGLPLGLDSSMGERGSQVSGGQRQRIALARALYRMPSLLILDEATSALDQQTERAVLQAMLHLPRDLTIVTVAHRPAAVRDADLIHVVEHGRVTGSGSFEDLLARHPTFPSLMANAS